MKTALVTAVRALKRRLRGLIGRKNILLLVILAVTFLLAGGLMVTGPQPAPVEVVERSWPVTGVTVSRESLSPELRLFGRVETPHHSTLRSAISAQIKTLHVREGQQVEAGQILVSLDPADEALRLQQAEADLAEARAQLAALQTDFAAERQVLGHMEELYAFTRAKADRLRDLNQRQLIATEQMENTLQEVARQGIELARQQSSVNKHPQRLASAEAVLERARARVATQRLNLERTSLRAPFAGRVSALLAAPGDRVDTGGSLLTLYDTSRLQVRAAVPSDQIGVLRDAMTRGQRVTASTVDGALTLQLTELASQVDRGHSGVEALFELPGAGHQLELGRALELRLAMPQMAGVIALPLQSLYGNERIYLIEEQRLRGVEVTLLGQRHDAGGNLQVLVRSAAVKDGAEVLATSLPRASSGLRVETVGTRVAGRDRDGQDSPSRRPG